MTITIDGPTIRIALLYLFLLALLACGIQRIADRVVPPPSISSEINWQA